MEIIRYFCGLKTYLIQFMSGGIIIDEAMGNKNVEARIVSQGISLVLGAGVGNSKLATLSPSLSTNIVTSMQASVFVKDISKNNKNIDEEEIKLLKYLNLLYGLI